MKRNARSSALPYHRLLFATLALLALAGTIGVATVWLRHQISEVARSNKEIQARTAEVERRIAETNAQIAAALDPGVLRQLNVNLKLGLASPVEAQINRIDVDLPTLLAENRASASVFRRITVAAPAPTSETFVLAPFTATVPR